MVGLGKLRLFLSLSGALASSLSSATAAASCADGCDSGFSSEGTCWCDDFCFNYGDCCVDYAAQGLAPPAPSCESVSRSWRPAELLQARPPTPSLGRTYPDIGVAADGTATAVWQTKDPNPAGSRVAVGAERRGGPKERP
jgi:Somatomedin B domain